MMPTLLVKLADSLCPTASACGLPNVNFDQTTAGLIITRTYEVVAAASILFLVIGALRYALSGGDSAGIKGAKNTVIYAVAGLIISLLAFVAVTFLSSKAGGL